MTQMGETVKAIAVDESLKKLELENIVNQIWEHVETYNHVIESLIDESNAKDEPPHIFSETQSGRQQLLRKQIIAEIEEMLEPAFPPIPQKDVAEYEAKNNVKSVALEIREIANALFSVAWLSYLVAHCGERKVGWLNIYMALETKVLKLLTQKIGEIEIGEKK